MADGGFKFLLVRSFHLIALVFINFAISMNPVSDSTILRVNRCRSLAPILLVECQEKNENK
jgi:hypothetical protein